MQDSFASKIANAAQELSKINYRVSKEMDIKITSTKAKIESFNSLMSNTEGFDASSQAFAADGKAQIFKCLEIQTINKVLMKNV